MIILANRTWGGYRNTDEFVEHFGLESYYDRTSEDSRTDPEIIDFYLNHDRGDIGFCYIPDDATDWDIMEYDGKEWVVYVQNGKLNYSYPQKQTREEAISYIKEAISNIFSDEN